MAPWRSVIVCIICLLLLGVLAAETLLDPCEPQDGYDIFVNVREDAKTGTVIKTLNTTGSSDMVNLTMQPSEFFRFNPVSQELSLENPIDADTTDTSLKVTVLCELTGSQPVKISIIVSITDVNDNPPVFTQDHYIISVGETTSVNATLPGAGVVKAMDADSSYINNAIYYSIVPGPYSDYLSFAQSLRPETLQLLKPLDYESFTNLTVTILAKNSGSSVELSATAQLTVQVMDEDDLNPVFTRSVYSGSVPENSPMNTSVNITPVIQAADADVTLNASVTYSFHDSQGLQNVFRIDPDKAEVRLVGPIQPSTVSIVVQATQKDNPSRYGVAMLVIVVKGVNSNAPKFPTSFYKIFVSEAVPVGTTVLFVTATDMDIGATIHYGIEDAEGLFQISPESGAINVTAQLDFERTTSHTFTVTASDGQMQSTATVEVTVVDANDNTPEILNTGPMTFDMDRTRGAVVTTIQARDADAGTQLGYRLENYASLFSIDNAGTIRVAAEPADLTESQYQFIVVVTDNAEPPREKFVTVTVTFDPVTPTTAAPVVMAGPADDTIAIALGVVAAVFLVIIVILVVYICKRRNQNSEHLDKVKANRSPDPRGLKFKNAGRGISFRGEMEETSDGDTTLQENPLKAGAFNYGFVHPDDAENDRNMDEIHIETAIIPYREADVYNNNDGSYEDSSEYGYTLPNKHSLMNGPYSGSSDSVDTSNSSDGQLHLVANGSGPVPKQPDKSKPRGNRGTGGGQVLQTMSLEGLDPNVSVAPREQKSELTVYF